MAEVQYIPYGTDEIDYNQFLQNSANEVQNYVNSQPWSQKRKQSFLNAYQEIMNRGVIGASNDSGVWKVNHNGDPFPLETMSKRDKEMYGEAAYFIQQQMSRIPTRQSIEAKEKEEAEKKKEEIPTFDNKQFTIGINNLLSKEFGGREFLTSEWNDKDKRGENGLRGITERANILANYLEEYSNKLKPEDFNFEGSAFENIDDFKAKISKAVEDLRGGNPEAIKNSLNKIGLVYDNYFNTGGNDPFTTKEGYSGTYNDYYNNYLPNQQKQKQQAEIAKQKAAYDNQYKRFRFFGQGLVGKPLTPEKSNINYLNQLAAKDTLNGDEQSELVGAFKLAAKNGALENLSKEELAKFGPGYSNRPGRLKKIRNVNGIYWDSIGNRIIKPYMNIEGSTVDFQNVLDQNNTDKIKQKQLTTPRGNGTELTDADIRDITATVADLASLVNPEIITGTATALGASALRTWNNVESKGWWDTLTDWKTWADWGTGALGGTPLLGDASSLVKFARGFGKLMTIPAIYTAVVSTPEAKAAWDKIDFDNLTESLKRLTPEDYHAISNVLVGALAGKNYLKGNLAERAVLEHSGTNIKAKTKRREILNKYGITRTKPSTEKESVSTLKVQKKGKNGKVEEKEIELTKEQKETLQKTKPSEVTEKAKEMLGDKIPEGYKVEINKSKINSVRSYLGKGNSNIFGTKNQDVKTTNDFENWLNNRSTWDQYKPWSLGTNSNLRRIYNNKGFNIQNNKEEPKSQSTETSQKLLEGPKTSTTEAPKTNTTKTSKNVSKEIKDFEQSYGTSNSSSTKPITGGYNSKPANEVNAGSFSMTIDGKKVNFKVGKRELKDINEGKITSIRNRFAKQIQQMQKDGVDEKDIARILEKLKQRGWLKQGGTIEPSLDTIVENFLKNYNK